MFFEMYTEMLDLEKLSHVTMGETSGGAGVARHPLEFEWIAVKYGTSNNEQMN